jgi:hypothetical protein
VTAGDAGVLDDEVGGGVLAAEDQLALDRMLAAGSYTLMDDQ